MKEYPLIAITEPIISLHITPIVWKDRLYVGFKKDIHEALKLNADKSFHYVKGNQGDVGYMSLYGKWDESILSNGIIVLSLNKQDGISISDGSDLRGKEIILAKSGKYDNKEGHREMQKFVIVP